MSTRWYPLYQKGNPQLRVFLPNFWLKLVQPLYSQPKNIVQFQCSMEMTKIDVKNYLEKIYNVKPIKVNTAIVLGKTKNAPGKKYIIKEDDVKVAFVTLEKNESFVFPDLFPEEKKKTKEREYIDDLKKEFKNYLSIDQAKGNVSWFRM